MLQGDVIVKKFIVPCVIGVVCLIIGIFIGDSREINRVNKEFNNTVKTSYNIPKKDQLKKEPTVIGMGVSQKSGDWEIKVLEAKEATQVSSDHGEPVKTNDKFIIVKLQLKNLASSKIQYSNNDFILIKSNKSKYQSHVDSAQQLNLDEKIYKKNNNFIGIYDDVNPGTTKNTYVSVEVPKDTSIDDFLFVNAKGDNNDLVGYKLK